MKKLVILDVNGILGQKFNSRFILRNGVKKFTRKLLETYDVGIFSSTTYKNGNPVIRDVFGRKRLVFKWFRDRTKFDPECDDEKDSYKTVKYISDVITNPIVNYNRNYNKFNVVIVDDEYSKVRFNDISNVIVYNSSDISLEIDNFDRLRVIIDQKFKDLSLEKSKSEMNKLDMNSRIYGIQSKVELQNLLNMDA